MRKLPKPFRRAIVVFTLTMLPLLLMFLWLSSGSAASAVPLNHNPLTERLERQIKEQQLEIRYLREQLEDALKQLQKIQGASKSTGLPVAVVAEIYAQARGYGFAPELLLGLIKTESSFRPNATNRNANGTIDYGLCQINSGTAPSLWAQVFPEEPYSADKLFDPIINVQLGAYYLAQKLDKHNGDVHAALTAYNRGDVGLARLVSRSGSPRSTYSERVLANTSKLKTP